MVSRKLTGQMRWGYCEQGMRKTGYSKKLVSGLTVVAAVIATTALVTGQLSTIGEATAKLGSALFGIKRAIINVRDVSSINAVSIGTLGDIFPVDMLNVEVEAVVVNDGGSHADNCRGELVFEHEQARYSYFNKLIRINSEPKWLIGEAVALAGSGTQTKLGFSFLVPSITYDKNAAFRVNCNTIITPPVPVVMRDPLTAK